MFHVNVGQMAIHVPISGPVNSRELSYASVLKTFEAVHILQYNPKYYELFAK